MGPVCGPVYTTTARKLGCGEQEFNLSMRSDHELWGISIDGTGTGDVLKCVWVRWALYYRMRPEHCAGVLIIL